MKAADNLHYIGRKQSRAAMRTRLHRAVIWKLHMMFCPSLDVREYIKGALQLLAGIVVQAIETGYDHIPPVLIFSHYPVYLVLRPTDSLPHAQ